MTAIPHSKTFLGEIKLFLNHQSCLIMLGLYILLLFVMAVAVWLALRGQVVIHVYRGRAEDLSFTLAGASV